jgi:hypothetical protein
VSEAKQSREGSISSGLLRHYAPRNDGSLAKRLTIRFRGHSTLAQAFYISWIEILYKSIKELTVYGQGRGGKAQAGKKHPADRVQPCTYAFA